MTGERTYCRSSYISAGKGTIGRFFFDTTFWIVPSILGFFLVYSCFLIICVYLFRVRVLDCLVGDIEQEWGLCNIYQKRHMMLKTRFSSIRMLLGPVEGCQFLVTMLMHKASLEIWEENKKVGCEFIFLTTSATCQADRLDSSVQFLECWKHINFLPLSQFLLSFQVR